MNEMVQDRGLPNGGCLVGGEERTKLVSTKGSQRHAEEPKNTCDLSGKLHKRGMIAVPTPLFNLWGSLDLGSKQEGPSGALHLRPPLQHADPRRLGGLYTPLDF